MKWKELPHVNHKDKATKKENHNVKCSGSHFYWLTFLLCFVTVSLFLVYSVCLGPAGAVLQWRPAAAWRWVVLSCSLTPGRQIQAAGSSNTQTDATPPESPGQTQRLCKDKVYLFQLLSLSLWVSRPEVSLWSNRFYYHSSAHLPLFISSSTFFKDTLPGVVIAPNSNPNSTIFPTAHFTLK